MTFNQRLDNWRFIPSPTSLFSIDRVCDEMFLDCELFDGDVSGWNIRPITAVAAFKNCTAFDGNMDAWDVSVLQAGSEMFADCHAFRGNGLQMWTLNDAIDLTHFLENCTAFNIVLSSIRVKSDADLSHFFDNCGLSTEMYSQNLKAMRENSGATNVVLGADGLKYDCVGEVNYVILTDIQNWTITDDGLEE